MTKTMKFDKAFKDADKLTAVVSDAVKVVTSLEHASETTPDDFDCYTAAELKAYKNGDWYYGTVTLWVEVNGCRVSGSLACIGGIEIHPDNETGLDAADEAAAELLEECEIEKLVRSHARAAAKAAKSIR
jgi:hypothetical protein